MTTSLTRAQSRAVDRIAIELGFPGAVLMENAGRGAAELALEVLARGERVGPAEFPVKVLCGSGNNGGDGYVLARHLANAGVAVEVLALGAPEEGGDAATARRMCEAAGVPVRAWAPGEELGAARLWVDGVLGTGFRGALREPAAELLRRLGEASAGVGAGVLALDLPSGLDADTGEADDCAPPADWTATFAAPKVGFGRGRGPQLCGRVVTCSIGTPPGLVARAAREA